MSPCFTWLFFLSFSYYITVSVPDDTGNKQTKYEWGSSPASIEYEIEIDPRVGKAVSECSLLNDNVLEFPDTVDVFNVPNFDGSAQFFFDIFQLAQNYKKKLATYNSSARYKSGENYNSTFNTIRGNDFEQVPEPQQLNNTRGSEDNFFYDINLDDSATTSSIQGDAAATEEAKSVVADVRREQKNRDALVQIDKDCLNEKTEKEKYLEAMAGEPKDPIDMDETDEKFKRSLAFTLALISSEPLGYLDLYKTDAKPQLDMLASHIDKGQHLGLNYENVLSKAMCLHKQSVEVQKNPEAKLNIGALGCTCLMDNSLPALCRGLSVLAAPSVCGSSSCSSYKWLLNSWKKIKEAIGSPWVADFYLQKIQFLPYTVPKDVVESEAKSYFSAFISIYTISLDAASAICSKDLTVEKLSNEEKEEVIHYMLGRWSKIMNIYTYEKGVSNYRIPLAHVYISEDNEKENVEIHVAIRGTMEPYEWAVDLTYSPSLSFFPPFQFETSVHRGFGHIGTKIWNYVKEYILNKTGVDRVKHFSVTGHSLGGGIASVVGAHAGLYLPLRPSVILFGAPRTGNDDFVSVLSTLTNIRVIRTEYDPVPETPCKTMAKCAISFATKSTVIGNDTEIIAEPINKEWVFADFRGNVMIPMEELPSTWPSQGGIFNFRLWHICAYSCWASRKVGQSHLCEKPQDEKKPGIPCPFI